MMWKTMYSLFRELPNEQQMYQSIAMVGNVLLKLGEFGDELPENHPTPTEYTANEPAEHLRQVTTKPEGYANNPEYEPKIGTFTSRGTSNSEEIANANVPREPKNISDVSPNASDGVTIVSELETSALMKEALLEAARSESSVGSPVQSSTGEDFVLVASDDGLSTPEAVGEYQDNAEDTLQKVFHRLHVESSFAGQRSATRRRSDPDQRDRGPAVSASWEAGNPEVLLTFEDNRPNSGENSEKASRPSSGALDPSWSISFEQFLASMLTEPFLVYYFEDTVDVIERLKKIKTEGLGSFRQLARTLSHSE